jgi:hypothetical protein
MSIPQRARDVVENLNINLPWRAGVETVDDPRYAAILGSGSSPYLNVVQRLRLRPEEVSSVVDEVRALFAARGRRRITWEVSGSATPSDLGARLMAMGMIPEPREPLVTGMVLATPLPAAVTGVTVRPVTTLEDFRLATAILQSGFGEGSEGEDPAALEASFAQHQAVAGQIRYLALLGDAPVAAADALYLDAGVLLGGGVTLPEARRRGAYRALVAARSEEGRRRGTPVLMIQAGSMSRPILARLGFEEIVAIRVYLDDFESQSGPATTASRTISPSGQAQH